MTTKKNYKDKINNAITNINTLRSNISNKISTAKIESFNEDPYEDNKPLYMFMYDTDLYTNIQIAQKLLNDVKASNIDFDGTAVEYVVDMIIKGLEAADRELSNEQKTRVWYTKMENIGKRIQKLLDMLLKLLSANIYDLKVDTTKQVWK